MGKKVKWKRQGMGYVSHDGTWMIGHYKLNGHPWCDLWRGQERIGTFETPADAAQKAEEMAE